MTEPVSGDAIAREFREAMRRKNLPEGQVPLLHQNALEALAIAVRSLCDLHGKRLRLSEADVLQPWVIDQLCELGAGSVMPFPYPEHDPLGPFLLWMQRVDIPWMEKKLSERSS
jgi:hypothetical protein